MASAYVFFSLLLALAISLGIFVPFTGVLVRFRANYNPKGLQLDSEGGAVPHTGPVVRSYFRMMGRVYRIEVCLFSAKASYYLRVCRRRDGKGSTKD